MRCGAFLLLAAAGTAAFSVAVPAAHSSALADSSTAGDDAAAAEAVAALLSARAQEAAAALPDDFAEDAGYRPRVESSMLVDPDGGCSSPAPLPTRFGTACKAHDLGYDLLRYASDRNRPLAPWARRGLDAQLTARLHASCRGETACDAAATVAARAVDANSWRQDYSVPADEAPALYALGGSGSASAVMAVGTAAFRRHGPRAGTGARG